MTNFEKIKQMSVEKFAEILWIISECEGTTSCADCPFKDIDCTETSIKEWLESEVEKR